MAASPRIRTIVITGGPCSGKTTALAWLRSDLESRGYKLLFVPEVATEFISGGVAPWTCRSYDDFQRSVCEMQLTKEDAFRHAAERMDDEELVIIQDRGVMDNKGYMTPEGFERLLEDLGMTEEEIYARYDAVFHLVSTAKGALSAYTLENNATRKETPEQAAAVDDRLIASWSGHPHFSVIYNADEFAGKMTVLLRRVHDFLEKGTRA